jgi:phospholipase D1/2
VSDVEVGFARTYLRDGQPPIKEVEALTLAALGAARRWIYAENQYLTSNAVVRALAARLIESDGPEITVVLPESESGWKERSSMGLLRARALAFLRAKDLYGRLRLVWPRVSAGAEARAVGVHAKVLVIDDVLAKIGSANFSNRSMGLDTECDLAVEASDVASATFVASVRNRLLGEHLGVTAAEVADRLAASGSLCRLIDDQVATAAYGLVPVPDASDAPVDLTVFDGAVVDPDEPWSMEAFMDRAVPIPLRQRLARRSLRPLALALGLLALWALFRRGPLRDLHVGSAALHLASRLAQERAGPLLAVGAIALASALFVPITLLGTTTLAVFGAWPGVPVAWLGAVLGATLSHAVGLRLGTRVMRWLPGGVESNVRRLLRERAFWTVVFMRLLPVGNFGALNLLAGAFKIPRRSFVLGNIVGMAPGLLGLGVFVDRAREALRHPSALNVAVALAVAVLTTVLTVILKRRLIGARRRAPSPAEVAGAATVAPSPAPEPRP